MKRIRSINMTNQLLGSNEKEVITFHLVTFGVFSQKRCLYCNGKFFIFHIIESPQCMVLFSENNKMPKNMVRFPNFCFSKYCQNRHTFGLFKRGQSIHFATCGHQSRKNIYRITRPISIQQTKSEKQMEQTKKDIAFFCSNDQRFMRFLQKYSLK